MNTNQYHVLAALPAVEGWEMPPALEALAQRLVQSGLLRINADFERNFVRHGTADSDRTFTARELTDPALMPRTRHILQRHVAPAEGPEGIEHLLARLLGELRRARGVDAAKEMRVARVLVQSAHPSVIALLLQSGTPVFVSYAHDVSDLLALHHWQTIGSAGGLQSTSEEGAAVYVSCGGDPFFEGEQKTFVTDGFPALARMMVIGGQELGHYADLRREGGQIVGRHSTDDTAPRLRADATMRAARRSDMVRIETMRQQALAAGLATLERRDAAARFYDTRSRYGIAWGLAQLRRLLAERHFRQRVGGAAPILQVQPPMYGGEALAMYLSDMAFNLAPDAAAYRRPDPEEEEAIACIEALARVPQQVHKWGHAAVQLGWPALYAQYFEWVIPACVAASGVSALPLQRPFGQRVALVWRRWRRDRPQYYP